MDDGRFEELSIANPEALLADGFEDAFVGICHRFGQDPLATYDYGKCIDILQKQGCSYEEAVEYFEFNVIGAWMGEGTPVFVHFMR